MRELYKKKILREREEVEIGGFARFSVRVETDNYMFQAIMYVYGSVLIDKLPVIW
jgi:hypothetical protein